jgi:hypothetical protein
MAFDVMGEYEPALAWGMTPFNASLAKNVSLVAEQLIQAQLNMFLSDGTKAIELTPHQKRMIPCSYGPGVPPNTTACQRNFLMVGIDFTPPILPDISKAPANEVVLVKGQQGYLLNYEELPNSSDYDSTECSVYGYPFAAYNLCIRNINQNTLQTRKSLLTILYKTIMTDDYRTCCVSIRNSICLKLPIRYQLVIQRRLGHFLRDTLPKCNCSIQPY